VSALVVTRDLDLWNLFCRRKRGAPDGWQWRKIETVGDHRSPREHCASVIEGGVCSVLYASGKRKGQRNWTKRDPLGDRTFVISFAEFDAFIAEVELETGSCLTCFGTGQEGRSWNIKTGVGYETCGKCQGTGLSAQKSTVTP